MNLRLRQRSPSRRPTVERLTKACVDGTLRTMEHKTPETVQVSVPVPTALQRRMKAYVGSQGMTVVNFVCQAIEELLDRVETKKRWPLR